MKKTRKKTVRGVLELAYDGYGFVSSERRGQPDIFIPAHAIGDALHKDVVEIEVIRGRRGKSEGRIINIIKKGIRQVVGRYEVKGKGAIVVTDAFRVKRTIVVTGIQPVEARHNEMVVVEITEYPSGSKPMRGKVIKSLGKRGYDSTEIAILIARHNLDLEFPSEVLTAAAKTTRKFSVSDFLKDRVDIKSLPFITIDGEDAKDFDDAVYAKKEGDHYRVWVSIADVSYFVREGEVLDVEASKRGTSAYLPGMCIPMLPEELSTNICSLLPGEDRLCFTAEFTVTEKGFVKKEKFYKSVIRSQYRMTYTEANSYLTEDCKITEVDDAILVSLDALKKAADSLRQNRIKRGSIDFDLPEPEIELDLKGKPENIVKAERNQAHMLIEDIMIAANEAVARSLTSRHYPCAYRVHDKPDPEKLEELNILMKYMGYKMNIQEGASPKKMAKVVRAVKGKPEERLINMLLLRSMAQAVYSTQNVGHYGLASSCYCHFTSPIRRYPDLLVHRLLADAIGADKSVRSKNLKYLTKELERSSQLERKAMEAEREARALYSSIFMRDKIDEEFDGFVSHTAKKGIFVELIEYFVEGMIDPNELFYGKYRFDNKKYLYEEKKTGRKVKIGDRLRVRVKEVNVEQRRIYFELADAKESKNEKKRSEKYRS